MTTTAKKEDAPIFDSVETIETTKIVYGAYDLERVATAKQTAKMIRHVCRSVSWSNESIQYAAIGACYQALAHGMTDQVRQLLESMKAESQPVKKMYAFVSTLTGGMLTITEEGRGADKKILLCYKFDMATKEELLNGFGTESFNAKATKFNELAQSPWWKAKQSKPKAEFDLKAFKTKFLKLVKLAAENHLKHNQLIELINGGFQQAKEAKAEAERAENLELMREFANKAAKIFTLASRKRLIDLSDELQDLQQKVFQGKIDPDLGFDLLEEIAIETEQAEEIDQATWLLKMQEAGRVPPTVTERQKRHRPQEEIDRSIPQALKDFEPLLADMQKWHYEPFLKELDEGKDRQDAIKEALKYASFLAGKVIGLAEGEEFKMIDYKLGKYNGRVSAETGMIINVIIEADSKKNREEAPEAEQVEKIDPVVRSPWFIDMFNEALGSEEAAEIYAINQANRSIRTPADVIRTTRLDVIQRLTERGQAAKAEELEKAYAAKVEEIKAAEAAEQAAAEQAAAEAAEQAAAQAEAEALEAAKALIAKAEAEAATKASKAGRQAASQKNAGKKKATTTAQAPKEIEIPKEIQALSNTNAEEFYKARIRAKKGKAATIAATLKAFTPPTEA